MKKIKLTMHDEDVREYNRRKILKEVKKPQTRIERFTKILKSKGIVFTTGRIEALILRYGEEYVETLLLGMIRYRNKKLKK